MPNENVNIRNEITSVFRDSGKQYWETMAKYGETLTAYANGKADAGDVVEGATRMVANEARRYVETGVRLGTAYAQWVSSLTGMESLAAQGVAAEALPKERSSSELKAGARGKRKKDA